MRRSPVMTVGAATAAERFSPATVRHPDPVRVKEQFIGHSGYRKLSVGDCGRSYETPCIH